ncbi:Hypothetical predicted protein [Olea europaea subsp. europaea]|uniref:Uncharacterized protein n=1 Tax=Olea europaea subsp. europaea TaxID=158383 RepID=A0A8S0TVF3_OLEEU|nr:Hypothetical predicted protein [Olea europaea subsp. europaea]
MGCCQSSKSQPEMENHSSVVESKGGRTGVPPLPMEEETVKEVLSETPVEKGSSQKVEKLNERMQELKIDSRQVIKPKCPEEVVSEASVVSDLGSFTESFSTTGMENRDDDDGEVNQRIPLRVPRRRQNTGDIPGGRIRRERSAPTGRTAMLQQSRGQVTASRPFQGRLSTAQQRNPGTEKGLRPDSGDISARRTRSPATSSEVGQRGNLSSKSHGPSETGRSGDAPLVKTAESGGGKVENSNDDVLAEDGESLENPIVSLECFIFL